ncbi:ATP-binding protein [Streptosporangium sp. NPDC002607]
MRPPVISQRFAAAPDQVRPARVFVAELLGDDHPLRDDAVLLTSELAANAVEHSSGPLDARPLDTGPRDAGPVDRPREFVVTVAFLPHGALITVQDPGASEVPCTRKPGLDATSGRGLMLVNDLATRWGFHRDFTGTVIWFELCSTSG